MTSRNKKKSDDPWALAKKKYRLNSDQLTKAKELGMNPKKFGKSTPNKSEPWKGPLGEFIEEWYQKRFKKSPSDLHSGYQSFKSVILAPFV